VEEAADYFAAAEVPVEPRRLAAIIRALAWRPVGETRSGERGGRGKAQYLARDFQMLHRDLAEWLVRIPDPGAGASSDPRE
jgi:CubicO group peptidase (beta-lactamase class C family)